MAVPATHKGRVWLWVRLTIGAGLMGIAIGYYLQVIGRLEMTSFLIFSFTVRGMIIGAFFWMFQIFWVAGPKGKKLRALATGPRLTAKVVVYVVLIETGYWIGELIFRSSQIT
ncbi:MAG: hypothetical protein HQ503_07015 [Rhodospirillales bacterium]|nr:hypothetical protein [Rhodospirillales bacterium]